MLGPVPGLRLQCQQPQVRLWVVAEPAVLAQPRGSRSLAPVWRHQGVLEAVVVVGWGGPHVAVAAEGCPAQEATLCGPVLRGHLAGARLCQVPLWPLARSPSL